MDKKQFLILSHNLRYIQQFNKLQVNKNEDNFTKVNQIYFTILFNIFYIGIFAKCQRSERDVYQIIRKRNKKQKSKIRKSFQKMG